MTSQTVFYKGCPLVWHDNLDAREDIVYVVNDWAFQAIVDSGAVTTIDALSAMLKALRDREDHID